MDFSLNDEQQATRDLAAKILEDISTPERLRELEKAGQHFDAKAWSALADAGLLGIAVPEAHGGAGLGFLEASLVLEEVGRRTAKVPYLTSCVVAAGALASYGSAEQQSAWLPGIASGERIVTAVLAEVADSPSYATLVASGSGSGWTVSGEVSFVPAGLEAHAALVPARTSDGTVGVFLVDLDGVSRTRQDITNDIPEAILSFEAAAASLVGSLADGAAITTFMVERATAALCSVAVGVCDRALRITADYTKTREQFGRPIATFQAVSQRSGDAYIDTEAVRLTALHAAWRISEGLPAAEAVAIAKFWAADGGQRVVHAAQHLHGGMGVDRDYPVHRYFLWAKHIELSLGGATRQLLKLGDLLADTPV